MRICKTLKGQLKTTIQQRRKLDLDKQVKVQKASVEVRAITLLY